MPGGAPTDYYALLQLPLFESDIALIAQAAQRLTAYLQSVHPGPHLLERDAVLEQIQAAARCLLDPAAKSQYDAALHSHVRIPAVVAPVPMHTPSSTIVPAALQRDLPVASIPPRPLTIAPVAQRRELPVAAPPPLPAASGPVAPPVEPPPVFGDGTAPMEATEDNLPGIQLTLAPPTQIEEPRTATFSIPRLLMFLLFAVVGGLGLAAVCLFIDRAFVRPPQMAIKTARSVTRVPRASETISPKADTPRKPAEMSTSSAVDAPPSKPVPETPAPKTNELADNRVSEPKPQNTPPQRGKSKEGKNRKGAKKVPPAKPSKSTPMADLVKRNAFDNALRQGYSAMAERRWTDAERHLKTARENAQITDESNQVVRAETVSHSLTEFWRLINQRVKALKPLEELAVADTRVVVVQVDAQVLTIKAEGRVRRYSVETLPGWAIKALAEDSFAKDAATQAIFATFLAVDRKGDRDLAKRMFAEVARKGMDVRSIQPELDLLPPQNSPY